VDARRTLVDEDWEELVYSVSRGSCVVMLGPDAVNYEVAGRPTNFAAALTRHLERRLKEDNPYISTSFTRTSEVADAIIKSFRGDRAQLVAWVREFIESRDFHHPTLAALAELPIGLVVNTAPGLPVERSFDAARPSRSVAHYDRNGRAVPLVPDWGVDEPLIYHLYGSLAEPDSLVLADRELLDVLVAVIRDQPGLPKNVVSAFRDPERTFLFLGFQLYHWQLRVLMHVLDSASPRTSRSFALEFVDDVLDEGTVNFYRGGHGIDFFELPVDEFVSELVHRVGGGAGGPALSPSAPSVFLCHADEDKEVADHLARDLRARGLNTWLDKDDIRGGVAWDPLIERTIRDDAGYVVVLQSSNLLERRSKRSYVNKEIAIALEVQQLYPPDRVFLVPVRIDRSDCLIDELNHRQTIDLTESRGVDALVKDITRDIQRGQKR
jgi:hypothetical protein